MANYKLIIFDVDGTLADRDTNVLKPNVYDWFEAHGSDQAIAIATNQGGVGLRWWMVEEGFGEPDKYPDEQDVLNHLQAVVNQLPERFRDLVDTYTYICFAYQSKKSGKWSPTPRQYLDDHRWSPLYRKPNPGMLNKAIYEANVQPAETLMVGDNVEDGQAAHAAGCHFQEAVDFFMRSNWEAS